MGTRIAGLGLGFFVHMLLARFLGVEGYGQYALLLSWALLLVAPVKLGMDQAILKFAAGYWQAGQHDLLAALARTSLLVVGAMAGLVGALVVGLTWARPGTLGAETPLQAVFLAVLVGLLALLGTFSIFFRAARRVFASQVFDQVLRQALTLVALGACLVLGVQAGVNLALGITIGAVAVALLWMLGLLKTTLIQAPPAPRPPLRLWMGVALPLLMTTVFQQATTQANTLLLGMLGSKTDVAHFAVAARLAAFVPFVMVAVGMIAGPMVAGAWARKDHTELARIAVLMSRLSLATGLGIAAVLALAGPLLLGLFGPEYRAAQDILLVLLLGGVINAATGATGPLISMTDMQRQSLWTSLLALLGGVLACLWLIPSMGAMGAAVAATLAMALRSVSRLIWVWVRLGIDSSALGLHRSR